MATVLYRINGGEVYKISSENQDFSERDTTYWGSVTDPNFPDGTDLIDPNTENSERRELGFAKIYDGVDTVRNAIQSEIDNFYVAEETDENLQDADGAVDLFDVHPRFRKMMVAFADIIGDEINLLRQRNNAIKNMAAASANFGDFKSYVSSLATQSDRTLAQLKSSIKARIDPDD